MDAADKPLTLGAAYYPSEIEYANYLAVTKPEPVVSAEVFAGAIFTPSPEVNV